MCAEVRGRPLRPPRHLHPTSKGLRPTERFHGGGTLSSSTRISHADKNDKQGKLSSSTTLPTPPQVFPPSCPNLRICVSVLDTLIHSYQHARADHPSVLGKLAFKLRYFREVNHPRASQHCLQPFLVEGRPGAVACKLVSLQGAVCCPWLSPGCPQPLKGRQRTPSTNEDISSGLNNAPSLTYD